MKEHIKIIEGEIYFHVDFAQALCPAIRQEALLYRAAARKAMSMAKNKNGKGKSFGAFSLSESGDGILWRRENHKGVHYNKA